LRQQLVGILLGSKKDTPTIITGDFNNKGVALAEAFPELIQDNVLAQAVKAGSTVIGYDEQLDHILYQPAYFLSASGFAENNGSDHLAIGATLQLL
jgi:endonuclease/exonuclease/phosphatase family metal-dependent hydrolase